MANLLDVACAVMFILLAVSSCEATPALEVQASSAIANTGGRKLQGVSCVF
jgi:hypothetical protein